MTENRKLDNAMDWKRMWKKIR